ncbi:histone-lysine N-methyltransferase SETMAR [Trichonephila clavipes]|nr:histone-lysine N-methyltransferase SETMAR [Trichonephila clavipes]
MSENIEQNTAKTLANSNFALQVDETDITGNAQLIAFVRYIHENDTINQFLCCRELPDFTTGKHIFQQISIRDPSLQESDQSERPSKIDNVLRSRLENNPHLTSREFAEEFGIHHSTVGNHIKSLGHDVEPFLDRLIPGDEKWILYENIRRKNTAKQEHQQFQNQVSNGAYFEGD